ncbi:hypothetical protein SLEP1_g56781 [Rubroshorea leprosula]|uniref:Uncharacterized protein n=1 Tax=Rubroshorea leprosula TaxID=152421 RepID=A0AAV5MJI6_9ROSI|nr:hypothetical protein SLEP1_g56781 [Rubroshorea leprosula]
MCERNIELLVSLRVFGVKNGTRASHSSFSHQNGNPVGFIHSYLHLVVIGQYRSITATEKAIYLRQLT